MKVFQGFCIISDIYKSISFLFIYIINIRYFHETRIIIISESINSEKHIIDAMYIYIASKLSIFIYI